MSESRVVIIDGYNLIHRTPMLRPEKGRTLREAREKLVNLLSWAYGSGGDAHFLIVFDGAEERGNEQGSGRVEVRFSRPPDKADDVIRRLVEERLARGEHVSVVTADLEVARHARAMGAEIALSDLFMASALGPRDMESPEKPDSISKKELEEWAALFRERQGRAAEGETEH